MPATFIHCVTPPTRSNERGALRARINMDLGLLYKLKRQPGRARTFLEIARVPAELQGATSLVGKIDAALAELP